MGCFLTCFTIPEENIIELINKTTQTTVSIKYLKDDFYEEEEENFPKTIYGW